MGQAAEKLTVSPWYYGNDIAALFFMASALDLKDPYTHAHAHRVAEYAKRLAVRAELPMSQVIQITIGGMLHDVGKLALSDKILSNCNAVLTEEMQREVYNHPLIGAALVQKITCKKTIFEAVLFHHERIDGSGYPFGLKADEIPLTAKIISIADCFDAVTTDRPYQRRKSCRLAKALLIDSVGTGFDSKLVSLFVKDIEVNGMVRPSDIRHITPIDCF